MSTYIVLPAYNEGKVIQKTIENIRKEGFNNIIVVDDGCKDNTSEIARTSGAIVVKHPINRGKGAATQTGLDAAKLLEANIIVTMDSDGQHNPKDIKSLVQPIEEKQADVVIGSRFIEKNENFPLSRVIMNKIGNIVTFIFFGAFSSDSQSGFRAYSNKAANSVYSYMDRYEFESEMLGHIKKAKLKIKEVPIEVTYTEHSLNKYKGDSVPAQNFSNGIKMVIRLIEHSLFK